jgi:hypothetical protein
MYQEAIEQAARGINIFEFAQFSLTCPGTEFGILQPNPELERLDAALAAMCQPEDDEFEDFPVLPRPDRIDDFNAITFIDEKQLEKLFEMYDGDRPRFDSDIYQVGSDYSTGDYSPCAPSRSYHPGRIYGSGHYGNDEQERRYQSFIRDPYLVFDVLDDLLRQEAKLRSESRRYKWDEPTITMTIPNGRTEIEEGEIVDDVYPHDLLDPEPFIRAPVISYEAAVIMEEEFYEVRWDKQFQERRYIWDIREAKELNGAGEEYEFER